MIYDNTSNNIPPGNYIILSRKAKLKCYINRSIISNCTNISDCFLFPHNANLIIKERNSLFKNRQPNCNHFPFEVNTEIIYEYLKHFEQTSTNFDNINRINDILTLSNETYSKIYTEKSNDINIKTNIKAIKKELKRLKISEEEFLRTINNSTYIKGTIIALNEYNSCILMFLLKTMAAGQEK